MSSTSHITRIFGERIRTIRLAQGLSQEGLGELCSLDRTYISSLERGHRNVSLKNIVALAKALNITLSELFDEIDLAHVEHNS